MGEANEFDGSDRASGSGASPADPPLSGGDPRGLLGPSGVFHAMAHGRRRRPSSGALLVLLAFQLAIVVVLIYWLM